MDGYININVFIAVSFMLENPERKEIISKKQEPLNIMFYVYIVQYYAILYIKSNKLEFHLLGQIELLYINREDWQGGAQPKKKNNQIKCSLI